MALLQQDGATDFEALYHCFVGYIHLYFSWDVGNGARVNAGFVS